MNAPRTVEPEDTKATSDTALYETPTIEEEKEMIFPEEIWKEFSNGKWCFGCSNCNCN